MTAGTTRMERYAIWTARVGVAVVLTWNIQCALAFVLSPGRYAAGFELAGTPGEAAVRALGILFIMWNVTYPPVIWNPKGQRTLFRVVLVQQLIGLVGELWLQSALPAGHEVLAATISRFVAFDAAGLVLMGAAYGALKLARPRSS